MGDLVANSEEANRLTESDVNALEAERERLSSLRELMSSMKQEMSENRAAPKLLGVLELNETLIDTIIATVSTALTAMVCSYFTGLMTEIGENSGFYRIIDSVARMVITDLDWKTETM